MMRRELENGVNIEERRGVGITLRQLLEHQFPTRSIGIGPLRYYISKTPDIPTPDLKFEDIIIDRVNKKSGHLIAVAEDEGRRYFIRDDQVLLEGDYKSFHSMRPSLSLLNLAVRSYHPERRFSLHLIDEKGSVNTVLEGSKIIDILQANRSSSLFLVSSETDEGKSLDQVNLKGEAKNIVSQASDLTLPSNKEWYVGCWHDYGWPSTIPVAYQKPAGEEYEYTVGLIDAGADWLQQHTTKMAPALNLNSVDVRVMDDQAIREGGPLLWSGVGKSVYIFRGDSLIFENDSQISSVDSSPDTLFAAYGFQNKGIAHQLFYTTPKGDGTIDDLEGIRRIKAGPNFIEAEYFRKGVLRTALITNKVISPFLQVNEQAA